MSQPSITPQPSDEEVAAILAALEATRPSALVGDGVEATPRWRWSGRWWSKPLPSRRVRPW